MTFVTVQAGGGWDTHGDNFKQLKNNLLPKFDQARGGAGRATCTTAACRTTCW